MLCVTTRFRLQSPWSLLPMYLAYRRMRRDLEAAPGLARHAFLLQGPTAVCTLSIWATREALDGFANVPSHVAAVRYAKRNCREIWSAYWELDAVSRYASEWSGAAAWPALVPDAAQPWRLVAPRLDPASAGASPSETAETPPGARVGSVAWDWSRTPGVAAGEAVARR